MDHNAPSGCGPGMSLCGEQSGVVPLGKRLTLGGQLDLAGYLVEAASVTKA